MRGQFICHATLFAFIELTVECEASFLLKWWSECSEA